MPNEPQAVETEEEVIWMVILQLCSIETQIKGNLYETTPIKEWNYAGPNIYWVSLLPF